MSCDSKDKIIVALDVDNLDNAVRLVDELCPDVGGFKIGLELITAYGAPQVVARLQVKGAQLFLDGKFNDIPNTVAAAAREATRLGVWMFNVHCLGGRRMMEAALEAATYTSYASGIRRPLVLGVTILTSLDAKALDELGLGVLDEGELEARVVKLALLARTSGLDGVVASPKEVALIRRECGLNFKIVTPGIRPHWAASGDQKRIAGPAEAIRAGADYLVIGRPITKPPAEIGAPADAARMIINEIGDIESKRV